MEEKSRGWAKENFICWLRWNLCTCAAGIIFVFFSFICIRISLEFDLDIFDRIAAYISISLFIAAFLLIPFLSSMVLTIIRGDMPFYYYGTVGLLFILLIFYYICLPLFYVEAISSDLILFTVSISFMPVIISSLAGSCVVMFLRNYKKISLFYK